MLLQLFPFNQTPLLKIETKVSQVLDNFYLLLAKQFPMGVHQTMTLPRFEIREYLLNTNNLKSHYTVVNEEENIKLHIKAKG